jgi:pimeloyl-ACP methyl ester carboxylesterase
MRVRTQNFRSALLHNPIPRSVFRETKTHAVDDAIISEERPNFPVVLFLPGFSAMPTDYTALLEDIASHGYIVAGINPTDFVPVTVFDDGRKVYAPVWNPSLYDIEKGYAIWVRDMIFVLNQISAQNKDPRSPFFGHLDVMSVGAFGHSFGGAASAGACHLDPRIRAGMNLDGAFHGDRSTWTFAQPFMLVQSQTRAYRDSGAEAFYAGLSTGYRAVINGSTHHAFMDEAFLPVFGDRRATLLGSVPGPRMVQITSSLVRAFFDAYLQNKPSALNHISSQFPEITVTKKQHETSTDSRRPNSLR